MIVDTNKKMLTETEVAEMLQCSVSKLRNDRNMRKGLPYYKIGRNVRYSPDEIVEAMEKQRVPKRSAW